MPARRSAAALLALAALATTACAASVDPTTTTGPAPAGARPSDAPANPAGVGAGEPAVARTGFLVIGDAGGGPAQQAVADAMAAWRAGGHPVDAIATTGDNVYENGEPDHFAAQLDAPYAAIDDVPMFVTLGNHDIVAGHGPTQLEHLGLPALPYERAVGSLALLFVDAYDVSGDQERWLDERLAAAGPGGAAVFLHPPVWSCGLYDGTDFVLARFNPLFERYGPAVVFTGHEHSYQRFRSPGGVTHVVTGGGGRPLYELDSGCDREAERLAAAGRHHFVAVEVTDDDLTVRAVATDLTVIDEVVVAR